MTFEKLKAVLDTTELPVAYHAFKDGQTLPWIVFFADASDDFFADDSNRLLVQNVIIELYVQQKDVSVERLVEDAFRLADITWKKAETWVFTQEMFMVRYTIQMIGE